MALAVNRITNANLYLNDVNLLGVAEEITIPRMKSVMVEHNGLGQIGKAEFPAGFDKLEMTIKMASLYVEPEVLIARMFEMNKYQVRGNLETFGPTGVLARIPAKWFLTGMTNDMGELKFAKFANTDNTFKLSIYRLEQVIGDRRVFYYNWFSNEFEVDGVDQMAQFRANIGG